MALAKNERREHLLIAADLVDRAMAEVEKAGYSVAIEKLRAVHQYLIKLVSYLETGEIK
ncbi:hypothetical protein KKE60_08745 [Patescibacteria group bacterium]|nr:hypothetical protein [Patescibacteria group bacterium]